VDKKLVKARSLCNLAEASHIIDFMSPQSFPKQDLVLVSSQYALACPKVGHMLSSDGTADCTFINEGLQAVGIADGAAEWESYGLNPRQFPEELLHHC
jgi:hypothetical protein